jgi:hypothetical protein
MVNIEKLIGEKSCMIKKIIIATVAAFVFSVHLFAQDGKTKIVSRKVLIVYHFIGAYGFVPKEPDIVKLVDGTIITKGSLANDNILRIILPYDKAKGLNKHWPIHTYLSEVSQNPFQYFYKDVFLADFSTFELVKHFRENDHLVFLKNKGKAAKIWILEAEWEESVSDRKPVAMGYPRTLVFDEYRTYRLKKILHIQPFNEITNSEDSERIGIVSGMQLKPI